MKQILTLKAILPQNNDTLILKARAMSLSKHLLSERLNDQIIYPTLPPFHPTNSTTTLLFSNTWNTVVQKVKFLIPPKHSSQYQYIKEWPPRKYLVLDVPPHKLEWPPHTFSAKQAGCLQIKQRSCMCLKMIQIRKIRGRKLNKILT